MRHPGRWWLGLGALALAWLVANIVEHSKVDLDIRGRATTAIEQDERIEAATAWVIGCNVTLAGVSTSSENADALVARMAALHGVRLVRSSFARPQTVQSFILSVRADEDAIVLSGDVPSRGDARSSPRSPSRERASSTGSPRPAARRAAT